MRPQVLEVAKSHIGGPHNEQTWLLLSVLSHCMALTSTQFALDYYAHNYNNVQQVRDFVIRGDQTIIFGRHQGIIIIINLIASNKLTHGIK